MNPRRFLQSDGAVALGIAMEAFGLLLALGITSPRIGVAMATLGALILTLTLLTGHTHE